MRILNFLRLTDQHDGNLSITNLAVLVVLVKIALASDVSLVDAGALLVTLVSYQGKKVINRGADKDQSLRMEDLKERITGVAHQVGAMIMRTEELASKVTQTQMAMGFKERK